MGASLTIFEREGVVRKIESTDFGESGQSTTAYYYRERAPILVLATSTAYRAPINDYGNRNAGKEAATIARRYYLAGPRLIRLTKDGEEIRLPVQRIATAHLKAAADALALATRCPAKKPPCAGCSCETKDCRKLSCEGE
jgi:hypothetical protein